MYIVLGVIARWLKSIWHAFGYWRDALAMLAVVKVAMSPYHQGLECRTTPFHFHVLQWKHLYALGFCVCHNNVHFPLPHKASSEAYTTQQDAQYASRGPNLAGTHDRVACALPAVAAGSCGGIANSLCRREGCGACIIYFRTGCCLTCSGRGILVPCGTHSAQPFCSHLLRICCVCICHGWMEAYWRCGVCTFSFSAGWAMPDSEVGSTALHAHCVCTLHWLCFHRCP